MQEKCENARGGLRSLASSPAPCFARQRRRASSQAIPQKQMKKKMAMLTVLGYKCPSFSFPVEIAPCCYTLDIGNKRDHLNVHVSVTKYIKKHVIKINGEIKHKKVKFYATFLISHLLQKNWVATVMQKFITSFLCLAYHTTLRPPPPPHPPYCRDFE